ncbi:hypothetical protein SAMN04488003_1105 [Loktanella fryxellensis]|uniref:50S ribosomal protein L35 n=1 Tax=Loktanella fryxellensis TaxID=245187 RepID=A0A1H8E822_9RHOB|nr:hypothetical protein [Loktanella fryxellensis]SEN14928.1 hypothetical protein SAMN04488003_1105 [Loktanella fryxellensis]
MDTDLIFVVGVFIAVLAVPAIISAFMDGRVPRAPALTVVIAALMIGYAVRERPMTYTVEGIPDAVLRVIATYIR